MTATVKELLDELDKEVDSFDEGYDYRYEDAQKLIKCLRTAIDKTIEAAESRACHHGWRGIAPERGQKIVTPCPACGLQRLFIGTGGHLTCASGPIQGCPSPSVAETVASTKSERTRIVKWLRDEANSYHDREGRHIPPAGTAIRALADEIEGKDD